MSCNTGVAHGSLGLNKKIDFHKKITKWFDFITFKILNDKINSGQGSIRLYI